MKYPLIAAMFYGTYWAVEERKFRAFESLMADQFAGTKYSADEIAERIGRDPQAAAAGKRSARVSGDIAVVPIVGVISHRASMVDNVSGPGGGASIAETRNMFRQAVNNPNVGTVVLDIDSPGGSVDGVQEFADEVFNARQQKRIIAVANTMAASAAYWIASAAEEFVVSPSGEVGSIGVYMVHRDMSGLYEADGVKHTIIKAGEHKAEGNPYEPLSEDTAAFWQSQVDEYYNAFISDVARFRGISTKEVKDGYGKGRTLTAKAAKKAGMVDRVGTFDDVLGRLGVDTSKSYRADDATAPEVVAETPAAPRQNIDALRAEIEGLFI